MSYRFWLVVLLSLGNVASVIAQDAGSSECLVFTLGSAVARAITANRQYIGIEEAASRCQLGIDYELAEFDYKIVPNGQVGLIGGGTAGTGPTVGGGIDLSKRFDHGSRISISPHVYKANNTYTTSLRACLTQPLLRGFGREYGSARLFGAQFAHRTAIYNLYGARIKLVLRVISSMYEIAKQEESVRLNSDSYERLKGYTTAARLKEKIGLSDSLDVYRAETELRTAEESLNAAQERLQDAYDVFRDLLSLPMEQPLRIEVPLVYNDIDVSEEQAIALSLKERFEIGQARDCVCEQERLVRMAKRNLLPELNLTVNYSNSGADQVFARSIDNEKRHSSWGVGLTTSDDFKQLSEKLSYDNALLNLEASRRNVEQVEVNVVLEVKRAVRTLRQAKKRIDLQEEQVKTAEGELHLSKVKFERGLANNFDVIRAERNLRTAHIAYLAAIVDHINGEYQLLNSIGTLADKPPV